MPESPTPQVLVELSRTDELDRLALAASKLGDITMRVLMDPSEAYAALIGQDMASLRRKYPNESEESLQRAAEAMWPAERMAEYTGDEATHRVTELTFTGDHGRRDLYFMATHGFVRGVGDI